MYNPTRFQSQNHDEALELMDKYPFATLISINEGTPFISHLPLSPKKVGDKIELIGHCARANSHWKFMKSGPITAIFHGPHAYITPQWYVVNDVPTWNYTVAHVTGHVELIESYEGLVEALKVLSDHMERRWPSGWEFFVPDDLSGERLAKGIVGFRILVEKIDYKKKLSQSQNPADRGGALKGLATRTDDGSRGVLEEMLKLYEMSGEFKGA